MVKKMIGGYFNLSYQDHKKARTMHFQHRFAFGAGVPQTPSKPRTKVALLCYSFDLLVLQVFPSPIHKNFIKKNRVLVKSRSSSKGWAFPFDISTIFIGF